MITGGCVWVSLFRWCLPFECGWPPWSLCMHVCVCVDFFPRWIYPQTIMSILCAWHCILLATVSQWEDSIINVLILMTVLKLQHTHTLTYKDRHNGTHALVHTHIHTPLTLNPIPPQSTAYIVCCSRRWISHTCLHLYTNPPRYKHNRHSGSCMHVQTHMLTCMSTFT